MHTTVKSLIYDYAGGIANGRQLKAVIPGGSSVPILLPDQIDVPASFDGVQRDELRGFLNPVGGRINPGDLARHNAIAPGTPLRDGEVLALPTRDAFLVRGRADFIQGESEHDP